MDGLRQPVGEHPPQVYWVRRIVVLVVAAAVVVGIWFIARGLFAGGDAEPEEPAAEATTSTSPAASAAPEDPSRPCTGDDLTLAMTPSPAEVALGTMPAFDVSIEHTGSSACSLSTATDGTELTVRSGDQVYYSTLWCTDDAAIPAGEWILQPGDREAVQATWTGQRYDDSCSIIAEPAAGYYWAAVAVAGIEAPEQQFQIVG